MPEHQKPAPDHFKYGYIDTLHFYDMSMKIAARKGEAVLRETRKRLGETDLFFLMVFIMNRKDMLHPWLLERCREVQLSPNGHLDLWARSHYKSSVITFGLTIQDIINDPEITIGIFSHTVSIARAFVSQIKQELESNEDLPKLWPDVFYEDPSRQAPRWSIDKGIIVKRKNNPKEATVEGHGLVEGMPTSRHFKLRVYDDVVTPESVSTPEQIQKTTEAWEMSDNLGVNEGGMERYIGTRYHLFDTYSVMMDKDVVVPRIHTATDDGTEYGKPVLLSKKVLADKRKKQGPYVFSSQQLQNPVADKSMGFMREWMVHADTDYYAAMESLWRFIIVDPASGRQRKHGNGAKQKKKNDYTSMFVIGYGADGNYRVLDMRRDRMNLSARWANLWELHVKWKPGLVAYEEYGMQADIEHMQQQMKDKLYEFDITPLGGNMPKELRILRLVPMFENGYKAVQEGGDGTAKSKIIFPTTCGVKDYEGRARDLVRDFIEEEYVAFPVLKHDDMLDCLARIVDLEKMNLIQTPNVKPAEQQSLSLEARLRKMHRQESDSWITA